MSDSDESGVTHTEVSSPFEDLSDIGSPRADDHELLELPYMPEDPYLEAALQAPPSPDYVPGPEEPEHAPPSPDYVPGAKHADDEIVAEDQPYAEDASPIAQSPDYVPESDPEADPEEDDDEDPEEDPIDYPADGGDDGDDEMDIEEDEDADMDIDADEEDEDDEMDVEIDEEAEEEHSAPAYPVVVALPATAPSAEETEPFETDESAATPPPHPAYRMTARITIPEPLPVPAWSDSEVARLLAISSPPASPLSPWSSSPPQIPFPLSPPSLVFPISLAGGGDEVEVSDDESSDLEEYRSDKEETAKKFKIETDVFYYETPLCLALNEFDYLLKVYDKPWLDNRIWKEPKPVKHTCKPFNYKTGCLEWPTCSWREDGYCNGGNLPGTYHIGNSLHYQDLEWYEALEDSELKDEALWNKAIMEGLISDDESSNDCWKIWKSHEIYYHDYDKGEYKMKVMKKDMSYVVSKLTRYRFSK
ncbi:hypothetical protein Tco_0836178 [Tanacetum coccineum]